MRFQWHAAEMGLLYAAGAGVGEWRQDREVWLLLTPHYIHIQVARARAR